MFVRLQSEIFNAGDELNAFTAQQHQLGAVATFTGLVRSTDEHPIDSLTLEHYPPLAQKQLEDIALDAIARFELIDVGIIHRFGEMKPADPIVQVMAISLHRQAAFDAASYVMDYLKINAPFWKKEKYAENEAWVDAHIKDDLAINKWK